MAEAEPTREIQATIRPSESSLPAIVANLCLVNHLDQTFVLDFGFADPLTAEYFWVAEFPSTSFYKSGSR